MRILLIDDSDVFRLQVRHLLREAIPDAEIDSWDPVAYGKPGPSFDWRRYDVLLLDAKPAPEADGFAWLRDFRQNPGVPPAVMLAETSGEDQAVRAVKSGATDYVPKDALEGVRLVRAIRDAILEGSQARRELAKLMLTQPLPVGQIGKPAGDHGIEIPGYRILREIGRGGMSRVYLAERDADRLQLVLKVLDPRLHGDPQFRERFLREYRIIQRVRDENVVAIFDQGVTDQHAYLAMEYFPGGDLKQHIRERMSSMHALKILTQIAKALDAVHTAGVVHRDLKPQNIMFRENHKVALLDFGLARELDATSTLTQRGMVYATPLYMSPEQCLGHAHGPRGDLYSAGVIFWEMLTGDVPYSGENAPALAYQHVHGAIPQLPARLAGYQPIIDRTLAKKPEDRFQSARELFAFIAH
ncbi:MAG: protein kinase [Burkholderiales bacterium]|jgi:tRNA A-37 threonylcarbamoyl transferase component Bud32/CheY-like chemotaxis protein|nr:protein kinase [Burkholderiales bacterium]